MPVYDYKAKKGPTEIVSGRIEAATADEAVDRLSREGLVPVRVEEAKAGKEAPKPAAKPAKTEERGGIASAPAPKAGTIRLFNGVRSSDITLFGRQLATLLKSGVPILRAIWIISEQSEKPALRAMLDDAQDKIRNGKTLSSVLESYPKYFSPLYIAMVKTGEDSGALETALRRVSEYRQKQEEILSHVRTALAYPILMAVTGAGTIAFMLTFVIPKLSGIFSSLGGHLPLPTRILMSVSGLFREPVFWAAAGTALFAAVVALKAFPKQMAELWSRLSLKLPFLKGFILKAELARFSRTLELLIQCGLPILRAIEIATPVLGNSVLRARFAQARKDLTGGGSLGKSLRECGVFPLFMTNLVSVAEESGRLDEAMGEIAHFYEHETEEAVKVMTSLLEPLMILVMGLIVGFIVIAMMLPMFEMNMMVR